MNLKERILKYGEFVYDKAKDKTPEHYKRKLKEVEKIIHHFTAPSQEFLVKQLVQGTANLELTNDQFVEFAPLETIGPFRLRGNSYPVFTYMLFEKEMMEFVEITVFLQLPNHIEFKAKIKSHTAPLRNGEEIPMKKAYERPFNRLMDHLTTYFGLWNKSGPMDIPKEAVTQ